MVTQLGVVAKILQIPGERILKRIMSIGEKKSLNSRVSSRKCHVDTTDLKLK